MFEYMTYENVEKKYGLKNHTRKCIDGKITSCGKCVGYCMYCEHSGFLTKELRKKHNCIGKQCHHYVEKKTLTKDDFSHPFASAFSSWNNKVDDVFSMACSLTRNFEGMRFMAAKPLDELVCELSYVTISNDYELDSIVNAIESEMGIRVEMRKLNYAFDNAVSLIMEKAYA